MEPHFGGSTAFRETPGKTRWPLPESLTLKIIRFLVGNYIMGADRERRHPRCCFSPSKRALKPRVHAPRHIHFKVDPLMMPASSRAVD